MATGIIKESRETREKRSKTKEGLLACAADATAAQGESPPAVWLYSQLVVLHLQQREGSRSMFDRLDDNATRCRCRMKRKIIAGIGVSCRIVSTNLQVVK